MPNAIGASEHTQAFTCGIPLTHIANVGVGELRLGVERAPTGWRRIHPATLTAHVSEITALIGEE
jgi:hypothetical protein